MITSFATPEGTEFYAREHSSLHYFELNQTGLVVSQAGFGCYRVAAGIAEHEGALRSALLGGINLVDTSSNYADGASEILVGELLRRLISAGTLSRESIVVVSKVGYLQGQNYELSQELKRQGRPFKELVLYGDGLEHCIHPEFLEDQLSRTLERLGLSTLDCYLLHNPEYYLGWAKKAGLPLEEAREVYYERIRRAFQHLEAEFEKGRIRSYGISSNTFPSPRNDFEFTSLERAWEIAESLPGKHHFRVIQLPMNLFETGAVTEKNQTNGESVIGFARDTKLGVLINRPLNAISGNRLVRLADVASVEPVSISEISRYLEELIRSEKVLGEQILSQINLAASLQAQILEQVATGETLRRHWQNLGTYERWRELQSGYSWPRIQGVFGFLAQQGNFPEVSQWIRSHQDKVDAVFAAIASFYQGEAADQSTRIKARVTTVDADWAQAQTLSQMAVRALRSTSGVSTVLVGMRKEDYVTDVLEELARPVDYGKKAGSWRELRDMKL